MKPEAKKSLPLHNNTVSEINAFLHFRQRFMMATKSSRKTIFGKKWQMTLCLTWGPKFSAKLLYLTQFLGDKCLFVINTEIQDGGQKWRENHI